MNRARYPIQFVFDDWKKHNGELTATAFAGQLYLDTSNVNADFIKDFTESASLRVIYNGCK